MEGKGCWLCVGVCCVIHCTSKYVNIYTIKNQLYLSHFKMFKPDNYVKKKVEEESCDKIRL